MNTICIVFVLSLFHTYYCYTSPSTTDSVDQLATKAATVSTNYYDDDDYDGIDDSLTTKTNVSDFIEFYENEEVRLLINDNNIDKTTKIRRFEHYLWDYDAKKREELLEIFDNVLDYKKRTEKSMTEEVVLKEIGRLFCTENITDVLADNKNNFTVQYKTVVYKAKLRGWNDSVHLSQFFVWLLDWDEYNESGQECVYFNPVFRDLVFFSKDKVECDIGKIGYEQKMSGCQLDT